MNGGGNWVKGRFLLNINIFVYILVRFIFIKYLSFYVNRKDLGKIGNLGKNDKYLNVYRYLDVFKFGKLLIIILEIVGEKICYVGII